MTLHTPRLLLLTLALTVGLPAAGQSAARMAPADTQVFIHIEEPADWFAALADGAIGDAVRQQIEEESDLGFLLALLGMDFDEFLEAYFGEEVVVLGASAGEDEGPGIILTKVSQDNRDHLIDSFDLKRAGAIGDAPMWASQDGNGYFVMLEDWVAFCDMESLDYMQTVLENKPADGTLADTDAYAYWTGMLDIDRNATVLFLDGEDNRHAMSIIRSGKLMDMTYAGRSPDFDDMMLMLGDTELADFGPLPIQTIAAVSFNLKADPDQTNPLLGGLDLLTSPTSFRDDILPKLDTPSLLFLGSAGGEQTGLDVDLPVAGFAVKMKDSSAAADLQAMMDRLVLLGNMATAETDAGPIPFKTVEYGGSTLRIAEVGKVIAPFAEWPELEPVQLVYGQVGDYYVVCTQEAFFKQVVDAHAGGLPARMRQEGAGHPMAVAPIMAMTARPDSLGRLLRTWLPRSSRANCPKTSNSGSKRRARWASSRTSSNCSNSTASSSCSSGAVRTAS
ncbi:MAG: hypothetical protein AAGC44_07630 [Planctomycetota bacterium]